MMTLKARVFKCAPVLVSERALNGNLPFANEPCARWPGFRCALAFPSALFNHARLEAKDRRSIPLTFVKETCGRLRKAQIYRLGQLLFDIVDSLSTRVNWCRFVVDGRTRASGFGVRILSALPLRPSACDSPVGQLDTFAFPGILTRSAPGLTEPHVSLSPEPE
jgi:hypothetical protein